MAYTRSEGTGETPSLQRLLDGRPLARDTYMDGVRAQVELASRRYDADAQRLLNRARAFFIRARRTPFPAEALEVE